MFSWRYLTESDYQMLVEWWEWFRFPAPKINMLPQNGLGGVMIVNEEGINVCAGFLYFTNSDFCIVEYVVSNPEYRDKNRKEAIRMLIERLGEVAKEQKGSGLLFTSVKNENLVNRFLEADYSDGGKATELIKIF